MTIQPAQSPDFNWLDLAFFYSPQSDVVIFVVKNRAEIVKPP